MSKKTEDIAVKKPAVIKKKEFSLSEFKKSKGLDESIKFKEQQWIELSPAFQEICGIPGFALGHINLIRGHSDTGKTTAMLEGAVKCQKMGILPVFIITEMKWSWEHAKEMGLEVNEVVNEETGEVEYEGFFIYNDRAKLKTIEEVAKFIHELLDEQEKGNLPYDLTFFWDSIGSVPCELSVKSNKNNNEWNAGAMSVQFGGSVNQRIVMSRKVINPYTNTLVCVNKIWVAKAENIMAQPKMKNKGGDTMYFDSSLIFTFGNVTNAGTSKVVAQKSGLQFEYAKITKVEVTKNHVTGLQTTGRIVMTPHGFIRNTNKDLEIYKKEHAKNWVKKYSSLIGDETDDSFETVIEAEMLEENMLNEPENE